MMLDEKKSRETSQVIQAELSKDGNSDPLQEAKGNAGSDEALVVDGEDRVNFFIWLLVACSSISGLLFGASSIQFIPAFCLRSLTYGLSTGYDTGVISGALVTIGSDLGPTVLSSGQKVFFHSCIVFKK